MVLKQKRWLILIASCFVTLCIGSLYAWSVFAIPMAAHLSEITGTNITSLAIIFTIANAVGPITMISGGFINDRLGPKRILLAGGLLFGLGMARSGFATSVPMLMVTYGLGVGLGVGMIYGTTVSNVVKFFPDKRGLAGGLITACYGGSSILIPPIATILVSAYHITTAFQILGIVMMLIICASAFVIIPCPADFNPVRECSEKSATPDNSSRPTDCTYKEMLQKPAFYYMILTLTCGSFAGLMIISQASPIAQTMMGFSSAAAAAVVSLLAFFNMLGRLISGSISDKIGAVATLKCTFVLSFLASILLYFCTESTTLFFFAGLAVIGFCFGSIMGIYPGFTAAQFGSKNNSVNYGIMFIGFAAAGLAGPMIMNQIFTITSRYQPAFLASAFLAFIGITLLFLLEKNLKKNSL